MTTPTTSELVATLNAATFLLNDRIELLEKQLAETKVLLQDVEFGHRNPDDGGQYNQCDGDQPCSWCEQARKLLAAESAGKDAT